MSAKTKRATNKSKNRKPARKISGTPFLKTSIPVGDRFRKGGVPLQRPNLADPVELIGKPKEGYADRGITILNALYGWRPPDNRYRFKRPLIWTVAASALAISAVILCNAAGSRYIGDLQAAHRLRPLFCQFLAAQAFLGFDTGQYAIIARCTQISPLNVSV